MLNCDPNEYSCTLKAVKNERVLVFSDGTAAFLRLLRLPPDPFGQTLESVAQQQACDWIYRAFEYLKRGNSGVMALREVDCEFWSYELRYKKPLLNISMRPIWNPQKFDRLYQMCNISTLSVSQFLGSFKDVLLLKKENGRFIIKSVGPDVARVTNLATGDSIEKALAHIHCINSSHLFERCLALNRIVNFADIYSSGQKCYYFMASLVPADHEAQSVAAVLHLLNSEQFYRMIGTDPAEADMNGREIKAAVGIYSVKNGRVFDLVKTNQAFDSLICMKSDIERIEDEIIPQCCLQRSILTVSHRLGSAGYVITAIPTLAEDRVFVFLLPSAQCAESMSFLEGKLTKREYDIACRVFAGDSIRGIALDCKISEGTVKKTLSNIYSKLNISTRVELIRLIFLNSATR